VRALPQAPIGPALAGQNYRLDRMFQQQWPS